MIYGIGIDLVDAGRIERLLARYGQRLADRLLSREERSAYSQSARPVWFLANRLAAKEALSKALGTGLRYPVTLHAVSVFSDEIGKPELRFHGPLPDYLRAHAVTRSHLSLSHEKGLACAMVVLECSP